MASDPRNCCTQLASEPVSEAPFNADLNVGPRSIAIGEVTATTKNVRREITLTQTQLQVEHNEAATAALITSR